MVIVACLGNPGSRYIKNRHNAGFIIGDYIARKYNIPITLKTFSSLCGKGRIEDRNVLLLLPQTYMNKSGIAVQAAIQYYREDPMNLIVIHDEIEIPFGEFGTKFGGGHKGHNGLRSIIQHIQTPDFHRIRFGVGRPADPGVSVADYLLSDFNNNELTRIEEIAPTILKEAYHIITSGEMPFQ
ncbi:MAG: aminoacyl-tRNA hydrolase [Spirochaetota bacterium]|nr:aminoacyl-tRNA hydrolase [Spirochaetota bacterium]